MTPPAPSMTTPRSGLTCCQPAQAAAISSRSIVTPSRRAARCGETGSRNRCISSRISTESGTSVATVARRADATAAAGGKLEFEGLTIDTEKRSVAVDGQPVDLTSMEFELLLILARRHGRKISRDDILSELRGIDAAILTRSVDIMISRLRGKLGDSVKPPRFIQTIWGRGYSFVGVPLPDA